MKAPLLEARALSAGYGRREVLSGVDLALEPGDFVGVLGPNGSGKTTLIRALTGIIRRFSGEVLLEGLPLDQITPSSIAKKVAVVSQTYSGSLDLPVEDIIMLGRIPHFNKWQWWPAEEDRSIVSWAIRVTETGQLRGKNFQNLSGGEQQRVMIALALAQKPRLILLDEPTLHLDINYQIEIFELLRKLNREHGLAVLAVLHDFNIASAYCRRLIILKDGRIWKTGPAEELITEEAIHEVFRARVGVISHPAGGNPLVFPLSSQNE